MNTNAKSLECPILQPMRLTLGFFLNGPLTTVIVVVGFVLNIISGLVFSKMLSRSGVQRYLVALSVWDNFLLTSSFFLYALPTLLYGTQTYTGPYVYIYPFIYGMANTTLLGTIWMLVALTIDRYRFVLHPIIRHNPSRFSRPSQTKLIIFLVSSLAIIAGSPYFCEVKIGFCMDAANNNESVARVVQTSIALNHAYHLFYHTLGGFLLNAFLPVALVFTLLCFSTFLLYRASKTRQKLMEDEDSLSPGTSRKMHKMTGISKNYNLMLYCIIAKFLFTRLMPFGLDLSELVQGQSTTDHVWVDLSNAIVTVNSATNFLLYMVLGKRFRKRCKRLLRHCLFRRAQPLDSEYSDISTVIHETTSRHPRRNSAFKETSFLL